MNTESPNSIEAYRIGRSYEVMPIAMVPEACVRVPAGPVTFVVEARRLTDERIISSAQDQGRIDAIDDLNGVDDGGASLHVLGTADGLEYLRFDCFDHDPHYHYVRNTAQTNVVVRLDTFAEGDPRLWTLARVRTRLPEMLSYADGEELAFAARAAQAEIDAALPEVERLLALAGS